jgi:hypothetical protein
VTYRVAFNANGFWLHSEPVYSIPQAVALLEYVQTHSDPQKLTGGHIQIQLPDGMWIPEDEYESAQIIARRREPMTDDELAC